MVAGDTWIDERYEVEELLGRGGMADVLRARDAATGTAVAVKVLRLEDDRSRARFRSEIEVLAHLDHPGVVRLRDSGWHDTHPYLVLDLVEGPTLATLLLDGPLGEERSVTIGEHLGAALAHAHGLGIVHRDVKPSNVLFEEATRPPRLADFGLARLAESTRMTGTGVCIGTAAYLSPEQLEGASGPPGDVYSLGLVVIECLTGALCYPGTMTEAALARLHRPPVVPGHLPTWLGETLRTMTRRDPERRPPADAVAEAFHERSAAPLPAGPTKRFVSAAARRPPPDRRPTTRRRAVAAAVATGLTAGAVLSALGARDLDVTEPSQARAAAVETAGGADATTSTTVPVPHAVTPSPTTARPPPSPPPAAPPRSAAAEGHGKGPRAERPKPPRDHGPKHQAD